MRGKVERRISRYTNQEILLLPRNKPVVSFTFDDIPASACTIGANMIRSAGGRATYYVCGGFDCTGEASPNFHTSDDLRTLSNMGHEIASHGFDHLNYQDTTDEEILADISKNDEYLRKIGLPSPQNFAYPYGCVSPRVKRLCSKRFRSCRGVQSGPHLRRADIRLLKSVPLYSSRLRIRNIEILLDRIASDGGWVIFFTHAVIKDPGIFDIDPNLFKSVVSSVQNRGIEIMTIMEALNSFKQ